MTIGVSSALPLSHLSWQCAGYLTANFSIVMNESNVWEQNKLRIFYVFIEHGNIVWPSRKNVIRLHCAFSFQNDLIWLWSLLEVWIIQIFRRILAWRDFPSVSSLTFWRINGVTSLPVIPLTLKNKTNTESPEIQTERYVSELVLKCWLNKSSTDYKPQRLSVPCLCDCSLYGLLYQLAGGCMLLWDGHG